MQINHPYGTSKVKFIKFCSSILSKTILFFLKFFLKIDKYDEIIISSQFFAPWIKDREFYEFFLKIKNLTLLDVKRSYTLWYFAKNLKNVNAEILDVGCCEGGSGFILSKANKKGKVYLIDTFEGLIEEDKNYKKKDMYFDDISSIKRNIKKFNLKNIKIVKCFFPKNFKIKSKCIKICHLDINTYRSTKNSFFYVDKKMLKNGVIIFDDYGIYTNKNIIKFIDTNKNYIIKNYNLIYNFMGQCILIKK